MLTAFLGLGPPVDVNLMKIALSHICLYRFTVTHTVPSHVTPACVIHTILVVRLRVHNAVTGFKEIFF